MSGGKHLATEAVVVEEKKDHKEEPSLLLGPRRKGAGTWSRLTDQSGDEEQASAVVGWRGLGQLREE